MFDIQNNIWFDIAVLYALFAIGNILMGHFEERTPKWRQILKLFLVSAIFILLTTSFGRVVAWSAIGVLLMAVIYIHAIWLPRHGIHGWTGEPKDKYYELRGWKKR